MKLYTVIKDTPFAKAGEVIREDQLKDISGLAEYLEEIPQEEIIKEYWFVALGGAGLELYRNEYKGNDSDLKAQEFGNFFVTEELAQAKLDQIQALFK